MNDLTKNWYIIKDSQGQCEILALENPTEATDEERWGPYASKGDAIARRVGLIRAGKCKPQ